MRFICWSKVTPQIAYLCLRVVTILLLAGFITSCRRQDYPAPLPSSGHGEFGVAPPTPSPTPQKDKKDSEGGITTPTIPPTPSPTPQKDRDGTVGHPSNRREGGAPI